MSLNYWRILAVVVGLATAISLVLFVKAALVLPGQSAAVGELTTIKVGGIFALSGDAAYWGQDEMRGAQLAVDNANKNGGVNGRRIEFIVEDAPAVEDLQKGVSAFKKLTEIDHVIAVIGPTWDNVAQAIAPLTDTEKTVVVSPDMSSGVEKDKDYAYFFTTALPVETEVLRIIEYAKEKGFVRVAIIRNVDPFSTIYAQTITKDGGQAGLTIVEDIAIPDLSTKDFQR